MGFQAETNHETELGGAYKLMVRYRYQLGTWTELFR